MTPRSLWSQGVPRVGADLLLADQPNPPRCVLQPNPLKVIDRQHNGDPFLTLFECDGKQYVFDEAALIESFERSAQRMAGAIANGLWPGRRRHLGGPMNETAPTLPMKVDRYVYMKALRIDQIRELADWMDDIEAQFVEIQCDTAGNLHAVAGNQRKVCMR